MGGVIDKMRQESEKERQDKLIGDVKVSKSDPGPVGSSRCTLDLRSFSGCLCSSQAYMPAV